MNNTALKIIAALLGLGSLVVAYMGWQLSQQPPAATPTPSTPASAPRYKVVSASRPLQPGHPIEAADLAYKDVESLPPGAFQNLSGMLGKLPTVSIPAGTILRDAMFLADSVSGLLAAGELAVAVQLDEVTGVGGYVEPGDRVDILYFMPGGREEGDRPVAQIAVRSAKVLTVGSATQIEHARDQHKDDAAASTPPPDGLTAQTGNKQRNDQRSAVLAVPEAEASRIMLAAYTGSLRLALRPRTVEPQNVASPTGNSAEARRLLHQVNLKDLVGNVASGKSAGTPPAMRQVVIQEGSKERRLDINPIKQQP